MHVVPKGLRHPQLPFPKGGTLVFLGPRERAPGMQGMLEREGLPPALTREKQPASWLPSVGGRRAFVGNQGFCPHRLSPCFRSFSPKWPLADPTHHGQGQGPLMSHTRPASLEDSRCFSEGQEEAHKVTQTPGVGTPCTLVLHRRGRAAPWASGFLYTVPVRQRGLQTRGHAV